MPDCRGCNHSMILLAANCQLIDSKLKNKNIFNACRSFNYHTNVSLFFHHVQVLQVVFVSGGRNIKKLTNVCTKV